MRASKDGDEVEEGGGEAVYFLEKNPWAPVSLAVDLRRVRRREGLVEGEEEEVVAWV